MKKMGILDASLRFGNEITTLDNSERVSIACEAYIVKGNGDDFDLMLPNGENYTYYNDAIS